MDQFLRDLSASEQQLAVLKKDLSDEHPDVQRVLAAMSTVNNQIEARIDGVLSGLETVVSARKAVLDSLSSAVDTAKRKDATAMETYRPYFAKRRQLETKQKMRDTIYIRILQ